MKSSIVLVAIALGNMVMADFFNLSFSEKNSMLWNNDMNFGTNNYSSLSNNNSGQLALEDLVASVSNDQILNKQVTAINSILKAGPVYNGLQQQVAPTFNFLSQPTNYNNGRALYVKFKSCLFLVDHTRFIDYSNSLRKSDFLRCYLIAISSLNGTSGADKYIQLLVECETNKVMDKVYDSIYLCDTNTFTEFSIKCKTTSKLPPTDLLLSCKKILGLDLYQRIRILEYIFILHLRQLNGTDFVSYDRFMGLYIDLFIRGTPADIKLTGLVLHLLYSDVYTCSFTHQKYEKLFNMIDEQFKAPTQRTKVIIDFFFVMTIGYC